VSVGILGHKVGMTQVFDPEGGVATPVTVVEAGPCTITQIKTEQTDGYTAIQIGFGAIAEKNLSKPELGHLAKSGSAPVRHLHEYRLDSADGYELGQAVTVETFAAGQLVDVTGTSTGKGFAGNQRRNNFRRGQRTHGSKNYKRPGSIGPGTTPGRVYPGSRMAGRMGGKTVTIRKLKVVRVDAERNLLLIAGSIPGKPGTLVQIAGSRIVGKS